VLVIAPLICPKRQAKNHRGIILDLFLYIRNDFDGVISQKTKACFFAGEKVLCYHGPLLYEAKCLEHRVNEKVIEFKVHYAGWNKRCLSLALFN
jgi:RNA binding activity-knot of a chromodomain